MNAIQRFFNVRREEVAPLLVAALYFFVILTALPITVRTMFSRGDQTVDA